MTKTISVRELREHIAQVLDDVARGEQVLVSRRGRPVARIIPVVQEETSADPRHPLRGSVRSMSDDFDEPIEELWEDFER